jgi:site-specific recombinase XerD
MHRAKVIAFRSDQPATWQELLEEFLTFKRAQGRSPRTLQDYDGTVHLFFKRYPLAWNSPNLKMHLMDFLTKSKCPATYNIRLAYLKCFFSWLVDEEIVSANPLSDFKQRKESPRIVNIAPKILKELLTLPKLSTYSGMRDYALLLLHLDTGIRPLEALTLLPSDFNYRGREVTVRAENAKTRISRTLPLSDITAKAIKKLLETRPSKWNGESPIYANWEGNVMRVETWAQRVKELYAAHLGVSLRPYDLRHAFALNFLRNGGNVFALQRIMGHSNLDMTKRYLALTSQDIQGEHAKSSPLTKIAGRKARAVRLGTGKGESEED